MKPSPVVLPLLRACFQRFFPQPVLRSLLEEACGGRAYARKVDPVVLAFVLLESYLLLKPSLRAILARSAPRLGTTHPSTLSYAIASPAMARLCAALLKSLAPQEEELGRGDILVLDSMAVTLPRTRRHNCLRVNDKTVGGGVLWALRVTARRGAAPLLVLRTMGGAWCDAAAMRDVRLAPHGPLHVMDRGFHKLDMMEEWLAGGVRFLLRARNKDLRYEPVEAMGRAGRWLRAKAAARGGRRRARVVFDGAARMGAQDRKGARPLVRLLIVDITRAGRTERLVLASSEMGMGAQELLDLYGRRWEVEEFHRLLKRMVGLAHLYSFRQRGIEALIALTALLAVLLWMGAPVERAAAGPAAAGESGGSAGTGLVAEMRRLVRDARAKHGLGPPWRPNTIGKSHWRHRS